MRLDSLRNGQRFRLPRLGIEGKLVEKGIGSATVEYRRSTERAFRTGDGKQVRISRTTERTTISLGTEVETGGSR